MKKETHQGFTLDGAGRDGKWNRGCRCLCACSLSLHMVITPFSCRLSVIFRHYCLSLSVCPIRSATLSLSLSHTLTYKHRELSLAYREPLRLWSKAFIWWLGLKNGHLLLPLINRAWACCVGFLWKSYTQIKASARTSIPVFVGENKHGV